MDAWRTGSALSSLLRIVSTWRCCSTNKSDLLFLKCSYFVFCQRLRFPTLWFIFYLLQKDRQLWREHKHPVSARAEKVSFKQRFYFPTQLQRNARNIYCFRHLESYPEAMKTTWVLLVKTKLLTIANSNLATFARTWRDTFCGQPKPAPFCVI